MDEHELALMLSDDEAPMPSGDAVLGVISQLSPMSDELPVEELIQRLQLLSRETNAMALVRVLQQMREQSVPRAAVLGVWGRLRGGSTASLSSATPKRAVRARSAASIPVMSSRALEHKRKQAECDLKLLQNRIALLQSEESKAWKKISQTQERAEEILAMRMANRRRQEEKNRNATAKAQQARSEQRKQNSMKKESVIKKRHAEIQVISKRFQDVEQVKTESRRLKLEREQRQLLEVARAREKREAIRRQEAALKTKKMAERQQADQDVALRLLRKVTSEERALREHRRRAEEMEQTERELIARLQDTQLMQQQAYSVLEHALLRATPELLGTVNLNNVGSNTSLRSRPILAPLTDPRRSQHDDNEEPEQESGNEDDEEQRESDNEEQESGQEEDRD